MIEKLILNWATYILVCLPILGLQAAACLQPHSCFSSPIICLQPHSCLAASFFVSNHWFATLLLVCSLDADLQRRVWVISFPHFEWDRNACSSLSSRRPCLLMTSESHELVLLMLGPIVKTTFSFWWRECEYSILQGINLRHASRPSLHSLQS